MTHRHRREFREAIKTARLTVKSMAGAMGQTPARLRHLAKGEEPLSAQLMTKVAVLLRYQADRLLHRAERLEALVREAGGEPKVSTGPRGQLRDH